MGQSNRYTIIFVFIMAVVVSLLLAGVSQSLKSKQEANELADMKLNILSAVGYLINRQNADCTDIKVCYAKNIKAIVVDSEGNLKDGVAEKIDMEAQLDLPESERSYPVFIRIKDGKEIAYCLPIIGKGLWGTIYGYMALEKDLNSIKGVTFYKHQETPGLGAEIGTDWFKNGYIGKKIFDEENNLVSVNIVKGKTNPNSRNLTHEVDGISGATLTCDGVNLFVIEKLKLYEPYLKKLRKEVE